jgi:hypothetical protein
MDTARAVARGAFAVAICGVLVQGCGPLLTVGGILGADSLSDDDDDKRNAVPVVSVEDPTGVLNDVIEVEYRLSDVESDRTHIVVEYLHAPRASGRADLGDRRSFGRLRPGRDSLPALDT